MSQFLLQILCLVKHDMKEHISNFAVELLGECQIQIMKIFTHMYLTPCELKIIRLLKYVNCFQNMMPSTLEQNTDMLWLNMHLEDKMNF